MFSEAYKEATLSPDPSTQVGALIINKTHSVARGYNHFPNGLHEDQSLKNLYVSHAEYSCIKNYRRVYSGLNPIGLTMVATWAACANCAINIIDAGIKTVYTDYRIFEFNQKVRPAHVAMEWEQSVHAALDMFEHSGVELFAFDNPFQGYEHIYKQDPIRVGGKIFTG